MVKAKKSEADEKNRSVLVLPVVGSVEVLGLVHVGVCS